MRITCPGCRQPVSCPESALGKRVRCPKCDQRFQVPTGKSAPLPPPPEPVAEDNPFALDESDFAPRPDPDAQYDQPPGLEVLSDKQLFRWIKDDGPLQLYPKEMIDAPGFSKPLNVFRGEAARMGYALVPGVLILLLALFLIGGGIYSGVTDPVDGTQMAYICVVAGCFFLGGAGWIFYQARGGGSQCILVYREGVVVWIKGKPQQFAWEKLGAITGRRRVIEGGDMNAAIEQAINVGTGRDLEYTVRVRVSGVGSFKFNSLVDDVERLAEFLREAIHRFS